MSDKCARLRKEVDDHRDSLGESEKREEACKLELQKLEKAYFALQKKVEKLESEVIFFHIPVMRQFFICKSFLFFMFVERKYFKFKS